MLLLLIVSACATPYAVFETGELTEAEISIDQFHEGLLQYGENLQTLSGNGRLLISQPGNSDRLSLDYHSDRQASLITFRNRIGIEGGRILVSSDSLLFYNRIDRIAERHSLRNGNLTELGALATVNLTELFNYPVNRDSLAALYETEYHFIAFSYGGTRITTDKQDGNILEVRFDPAEETRYSRVIYEEHADFDGFILPRKITIFGREGETRLTLLVRQLRINAPLPPLQIEIPDEIPVTTL